MTISVAGGERRGAGLLALVSVGILFSTLVLGARVTPTRAVDDQAACQRPLDVVIVIDRSGSMDTVTGGFSRLHWAKLAANNLVDGLQANGVVGGSGLHQVGLTTFGDRDNSDGIPAGFTRDLQLGTSNATAVHNAINAYSDSAGNGNTPFRFGMADGAANMLAGDRDLVDGVPVLQVLIFLSDGRPNPDDTSSTGSRPTGGDISAYLAAADQAYGIAIGPVSGVYSLSEPDLGLMHSISNPDPANFRHVVDAASLPNLFASIQQELLCGDIQITKTPNPAGPVDPGTQVTYTYDVWNDGDTPLSSVTVADDTCSPVTYFSGKTGNNLLEKGEIWTYKCTMPLQDSTTNVACAQGDFIGGGHDSACVDVTVEVIPPTPTPTPTATATATAAATATATAAATATARATAEQTVEAGTGTPAATQPNTSLNVLDGGVLPTILFSLLLITSLGTVAYANVRARRGS